MKLKNVVIFRVAVLVPILALAFAVSVPVTRAQSISELESRINALITIINAMQEGSVAADVCPYTWTRSLGQGSTGADVVRLQQFLNASSDTRLAFSGAGSPGMETQYYGPITAAAVSKFQVKYRSQILTPLGLINPTGFFGPSSRARANALCASGTPTPTPDDEDLEGGAGSIDGAEFISNLHNEEVGEDDEDVDVAGLEIEPEGSDIELTAVRLQFVHQGNIVGSSDDFEDYADEVSIWLDGDEVGRVDADEFDDDNDYSRTISLQDNAIIREGEVGDLIVAITGASNLDSNDEGEEWTIEFETVRFRDAQGAVVTENSTGDIGGATREFSFESFATAADTELSISHGNDDINDGRVINVDDNDDTDDVELLSMMVEAEGDSDIEIKDVVVEFALTGTATDLNDMLTSVHLVIDGDEVTSENASTGTTVTFDNVDHTIDAGDEVEFIITGDFRELNSGTYDEGDTISVEVTSTERNLWDVEDESGDELDNADKTGTASSDAHTVYDTGMQIDLVSVSETKTRSSDTVGVGDQGQYVLKYEVSALDGDIYIDNSCTEDNDGSETASAGNSFSVTNPTDNATNCSLTSTGSSASNSFLVEEGETETFTLTVVVTAVNDNFAQVALEAIGWAAAAGNGTEVFTSNLPGDFETDPLFLNMP